MKITRNFLIFIAILIVLAIIYIYYINNNNIENFSNCVCVFDIDDTITCGFDQAKKAIDECKKRSCLFAINTARTTKYHADIEYEKLGLTKDSFVEMFDDNFYNGTWNKKNSYINQDELIKDIAKNKTEHLITIKSKYNVPNNRIILFDDNYENLKNAKLHGFSTIYANSESCGLGKNVVREISDILDD